MKKIFVGYVIRCVDYNESDLIISVLTKEGIVTIRARGVKKIKSKNMSSTLLYAYSEFEVSESKNGYLTLSEGRLISYPKLLNESFLNLATLNVACEYIIASANFETGFDLIVKTIELIESKIEIKLVLLALLNQISLIEGCSLNVDQCVGCGSITGIVSFSYNDGGYFCKGCNHKEIKDLDFLKEIRILLKINLTNCSKIGVISKKIDNVIINLLEILENQSGIRLNSKKMLFSVLNRRKS